MNSKIEKPVLKYLTKINQLSNLFINLLKNDDFNGAFNILYRMRIIHGMLLRNKIMKGKHKKSNCDLFKLSCVYTVLNIINNKIIEYESNFNKYLIDHNINDNQLQIIIKDKQKDIDTSDTENVNEQIGSSNINEQVVNANEQQKLMIANANEKKEETDDNLPLFTGQKSKELQMHDILNDIFGAKYSDFDKTKPSLLFFHSPECHFCVQTKPHWDKLINGMKHSFQKRGKLFNIMEFDLTEKDNNKIANMFEFDGIPTFIMIDSLTNPNIKIEKISGGNDIEGIKKFILNSYGRFSN